jgi:hypothetical protein
MADKAKRRKMISGTWNIHDLSRKLQEVIEEMNSIGRDVFS